MNRIGIYCIVNANNQHSYLFLQSALLDLQPFDPIPCKLPQSLAMVEEGAYRVVLQDIHCELPDEDVKSLKFLVQPLIKKRAYQKIEDGLGLFAALEDCRMLSRFNLDFLSELLETVGRLDLQARYVGF